MFESRRQHPVAAVTRVLEIIRGNFITILIIIFVGSGADEDTLVSISWLVGTILVLLVWGILDWLRFTFAIEDGELHIRRGIFVRKNLYLTKDRVQLIDITSGLLQRLFGLVSVKIKTAGGSSSEAHIDAITRDEAERIRSLLREEYPAQEEGEEQEAEDRKPREAYRLSLPDLLIASSTSGSFGVALSIVGTVFSQLDQVVSDEEMLDFIESAVPASASSDTIIWAILAVVVVSWVLAFLGTVIKYAGFAVVLKPNEMMITRGLFEKVQLTIPYNRIQAVQVTEGLLRQPFGYASLMIDSAAGFGSDDESAQSAVLCPLIKKHKVAKFIENVVPEYSDRASAVQAPRIAIRRYIIRSLLVASLPVVLLWFILPPLYALGFYLPALLLGVFQYRAAALAHSRQSIFLRYRVLARTTAIVKKYRVQSCRVTSTPFQRRLGLSTFGITVASGRQGRSFSVRDLLTPHAMESWHWLSVHYGADRSPEIPWTTVLPDAKFSGSSSAQESVV